MVGREREFSGSRVVILKMVTLPSRKDLIPLITTARKHARQVGLNKDDISQAIKKLRHKKRKLNLFF